MVFALLLAAQISPWWYVARDGCMYLSLARNLAAGGPLECLHLPVCVPPGYPLLISPAFLLGDQPFLALSVLNWLFALALLLGVYRWARRVVPQAAVWVAGLTAVNAGVCYYYRRTLKEIAFMAAAVWAVNALAELEKATDGGTRLRRGILAALLVVFAILIRYTAIVFVAGLAAVVLLGWLRRSRERRESITSGSAGSLADEPADGASSIAQPGSVSKPLLAMTGGLGLLAAVVLAALVYHVGSGYLVGFEAFSNPLPQLLEGLRVRIGNLARVMVPGMLKAYSGPREWLDWNIILGLCLAATVVWGWRRLALERRDVWACALPLYVALYIIWPHHQGARFMVPMVPVLIACFWLGIEPLRRVRAAVFAACFAAHLGGTCGYWAIIDAPRAAAEHRYWDTAERLAVRMHFGPGEMIGSMHLPNALEAMLVLSTDRYAVSAKGNRHLTDRVRWVVQPVECDPREGYVVAQEFADYRLLERSSTADLTPPSDPREAASLSRRARAGPLREARRSAAGSGAAVR